MDQFFCKHKGGHEGRLRKIERRLAVLGHVLDDLGKIEQRLDALGMKDDKRMRDIMHLREGMRHEDMPGPCEYCGELPPDCECEHEEEPEQKYATKAEYIAQAEQRGMTEGEAAAVFDEASICHSDKMQRVIGASPDQSRKLPLVNGHLPELPVLKCPDVSGDPQTDRPSNSTWQVDAIATGCDERMVSGPIASTEDAAIAHWNRWMRERFGVQYGEE